jgi:hypothetical protein
MTAPRYRQWTPSISTRYPDIHGWLDDIDSSREFAQRLLHESESQSPDKAVIDAMSVAAIIRYCRCFTTGCREQLRIDDLPSLSEGERRFHGWIIGVRNRHISHPVNQQEAHALYVIVDETPGADTGALGISSCTSSQIPLAQLEATDLIMLCARWTAHLKVQLAEESERLRPLINSLSRAEIMSLPQGDPEYNEDIYAQRARR